MLASCLGRRRRPVPARGTGRSGGLKQPLRLSRRAFRRSPGRCSRSGRSAAGSAPCSTARGPEIDSKRRWRSGKWQLYSQRKCPMNGSARRRSPASRMNACWSSPATRPTSNIRSPRFMRSRSIAATSMPWPNRKFAGRRVAVQPDLLVLPHLRPVPPAVAQTRELLDVARPDAAGIAKPANDRVEVPAVGIEIDRRPVGRPVVLGGEEVGQRLQPPVRGARRPGGCVARAIAWLNSSPG